MQTRTAVRAGSSHLLVGRANLLASVDAALDAGRSVVLTGPDGMGKSALLDAVARSRSDELVLRASGAQAERWIGGAVLADLLAQVPDVPRPDGLTADDLGTRGPAWLALLAACAREQPVLLVLDDAQWIDPTSADVLTFAVRRLLDAGVRVVMTWRWDGSPRALPVVPEGAVRLELPPLTADDLAALLELHGLSGRAAAQVHLESAGNPFLALALAGAFVDHGPAQRPEAPSPALVALVRSRLVGLTAAERETLVVAALANSPTIALLERAGCADADHDVARAADAGLVVLDDGAVRFTPTSAARVVRLDTTAAHRARVHTALADVVTCPAERDRHLALADAHPDADLAASLADAAQVALRRGAHDLAAELYRLAADRSPAADQDARTRRLVLAATTGALAGQAELVHLAVDQVLATARRADHRVAARLALVTLSSQSAAQMSSTLAGALADAEGDPRSSAEVRLWLAVAACMGGDPATGLREADRARDLAREAGDQAREALACSLGATAARHLGRPDHAARLADGLALPEPEVPGWGQFAPRVEAARAAVAADDLDTALHDLQQLLVRAERGAPEELASMVGLLAQTCARAGRCRESVAQAARAVRVAADAGLSPGPGWYSSAVAELAGGTLERAEAFARQGARASEEEGDRNFLRCHLSVLGVALLRQGRAAEAVEALLRVQDIEDDAGLRDPSDLRWRADLVHALVVDGRLPEAARALARHREDARTLRRGRGVTAQLDRAEALLRLAQQDAARALSLAERSALRFAELGHPLEQGHSLLVQARAHAATGAHPQARAMARLARELFVAHGAAPWVGQAEAVLADLVPAAPAPAPRPLRLLPPVAEAPSAPAGVRLTEVESTVAGLVARGSSNREIAAALFVSVKTVEATLTRVYRKVGVRSRTQLSARLSGAR